MQKQNSELRPEDVARAIFSSIKQRAFSKRQSGFQRSYCVAIIVLVFSMTFLLRPYAVFISLSCLLFLRWHNLGVLEVKENIIFFLCSLYALPLAAIAKAYRYLYLRFISRTRYKDNFFEHFPSNAQPVTASLTVGETKRRDKFIDNLLPEKAPSPDFFSYSRIVGAAILFVCSRLFPVHIFLPLYALLWTTDAIDGSLARRRAGVTTRGACLDILADRLLVAAGVNYAYEQHPEFITRYWLPVVIPEIILVIFFSLVFILDGSKTWEGLLAKSAKKIAQPRPVVWGRIKITFYAISLILLLFGWVKGAEIFILIGLLFAVPALASYITRWYQERYHESIFNGLLRACLHSERISEELRG